MAIDTTLVSPRKRNGQARPRAHWEDGIALKDARKDKATRYPELLRSGRCRLLTAGIEVGGALGRRSLPLSAASGKRKSSRGDSYTERLRNLVLAEKMGSADVQSSNKQPRQYPDKRHSRAN